MLLKPLRQIAAERGYTSDTTVYKACYRRGILTPKGGAPFKLTPDKIEQMLEMRRDGKFVKDVAAHFGVHEVTVRRVFRNERETHGGRKPLQLDEKTKARIRAALVSGARRRDVCRRFGFSDRMLVRYGFRVKGAKHAG